MWQGSSCNGDWTQRLECWSERREAGRISADAAPAASLSPEDAQALVNHLMALRPQSAFALKAAVMALETPGVEGTLTIKINRSPKDWPDLTFTT